MCEEDTANQTHTQMTFLMHFIVAATAAAAAAAVVVL